MRLARVGWGHRESIPTQRPHNRKKMYGIWAPKQRWGEMLGVEKAEKRELEKGMKKFFLHLKNNRQLENFTEGE